MRRRVWILLCVLLLSGGTQAIGTAQLDDVETSQRLVSLEDWPPGPALADDLDRPGVQVQERFDAAETLLVEAPDPVWPLLAGHPAVAGVYEDEPLEPFLASSKPAAGVTEQVQRSNVSGEGVKIAVVDSGIDADHPGLDAAVAGQYQVDDDGVEQGSGDASLHGTHVSGVLAGSGEGIREGRADHSGVAPGAQIVSFDISSDFTTSNALRAFEWIYDNHESEDIQIVANAWGRLEQPIRYQPDDPVVQASSALVAEGVTVIFSAGNGGGEASRMTVEGANPDVITVGAATDGGQVEGYSSQGPVYDEDGNEANWTKPDLVAPGSHVVSTEPSPSGDPSYVKMNGTSMAAPHVAGVAALLLDHRPDLSPEQVKGLLVRGAEDIGPEGVDDASGAGMLDARASLEILSGSSQSVERRSHTESHTDELTGPGQAEAVFAQTDVEHEDTFEVQVPANATSLETEIAWNGRGGLETTFTRPDGSTARTVTVDGEETVDLSKPDQGTWEVHVEPEDASKGSYHANATVTWLEPVNGTAIPFSSSERAQGSFPSSSDALDPWASSWVPGVPNVAFMLGGAAMTVSMLVGRIRE